MKKKHDLFLNLPSLEQLGSIQSQIKRAPFPPIVYLQGRIRIKVQIIHGRRRKEVREKNFLIDDGRDFVRKQNSTEVGDGFMV